MKAPYLTVSFMLLALTACQEHKNPLLDFPATDISKWVYEHQTPGILGCSAEWKKAGKMEELSGECKQAATILAADLKKAGFGDVLPKDILLPTIWDNFAGKLKNKMQNTFNPNLTKDIFK